MHAKKKTVCQTDNFYLGIEIVTVEMQRFVMHSREKKTLISAVTVEKKKYAAKLSKGMRMSFSLYL